MMNHVSVPALLLALHLVAVSRSFAQPPDPLAVRKAIDNSCLTTPGTKDQVSAVEEIEIPVGDLKLPTRLYRPNESASLPLLLFFHGGGFVAGNLDTHDNACRYLCKRTPCLVLAVDYRLAPEHKFPAQPEDCYAATAWAANNAVRLGGDPDRLAVIGDSAGGALAAAVCLMSREREWPKLRGQVLVNPVLDFVGWDQEAFDAYRRFRDFYLNEPKEGAAPLASPLQADSFQGLPPAFVVVGEEDPLRAEGEAYVAKLRAAGVPANSYCQFGQGHLGPNWAAAAAVAEEALDLPIGFLRAAFKKPKP